jgi:hypothetical protein
MSSPFYPFRNELLEKENERLKKNRKIDIAYG